MEIKYLKPFLQNKFPDDNTCLELIFNLTFRDKTCKKCNHTKFYRVKSRKCYECGKCGTQIFPLAGTFIKNSKTPLMKWIEAIYEFVQSTSGISAIELARRIGVTYKTAWKILYTIRQSLKEDLFLKLSGSFEIDETYIGGRKRAKVKEGEKKVGFNGHESKEKVFGIYHKRSKTVKAFHVETTTKAELFPLIFANIPKGSSIHSDEYIVYTTLKDFDYRHRVIQHKKYEFLTEDGVTTNRIESFWSYFKNPIRGIQKHVSKKHLQSYLDESTFRYNHCKQKPIEKFNLVFDKLLKAS